MAEFACSAIRRFADRTYLTKLGHAILLNFRFANRNCQGLLHVHSAWAVAAEVSRENARPFV